jgi:hypothetical protein
MTKKILIAAALGSLSLSSLALAQGTASLVETLQRDGVISFAAIRDARALQFDTLDKDKSGGLSQDEASGALSIAGGRRPGGAGMAGGGQGAGMAGGGQGAGMAGNNMSDDERAKRRKAMRERMEQRGGGQGGQGGQGGRRGAMAEGGGNPLERMQFTSADGDFNGSLSKTEFVEAPFPTLVAMDKDMDSRLTVEEIQAAPGRGGRMQPSQ